jgi:hypothetical protein
MGFCLSVGRRSRFPAQELRFRPSPRHIVTNAGDLDVNRRKRYRRLARTALLHRWRRRAFTPCSLSLPLDAPEGPGGVAWQQNPRSRLAAGFGDPSKLFKKTYDVGGDVRTETGYCNTREQNHPNRLTARRGAQHGGGSLRLPWLGLRVELVRVCFMGSD